MNSQAASPVDSPFLVACLCARWCDLCGQYRAVFDAAAAANGEQACFVWVDIEDDEDLLGAVEVENFPTLLIAGSDAALFFGPLTPQPATLARLLRSALAGELRAAGDAEVARLAGRLRAASGRLQGAAG